MPWTLAHPVAVVPLIRWRGGVLPWMGLAVGSMSPDFGLYLFRYDLSGFAHSPVGIVGFCVPVSLVIVAVFSRLWEVLTAPLPEPHRSALRGLPRPRLGSWRGIVACAVACGIGAMTHMLWDSFTHANTPVVQALPMLRIELFTVMGRTFRVYQVLQHLSTALGLVFLVGAYLRWIRSRLADSPANVVGDWSGHLPWFSCCCLAATSGVLAAFLSLGSKIEPAFVVRSVILASVAFVVLYAILSVVMALREQAARQGLAERDGS